jgi:protein-disulfide isomerase
LSTSQKLERSAFFFLVLIAIALGGIRIKQYFGSSPPGSLSRIGDEPEWRSFATDGRVLRDSGAADTIVVFSDYQCPFCQLLEKRLDTLINSGVHLHHVHRHLPSKRHPLALLAVRVAECADAQGRMEPMHALLMEYVDSLQRFDPKWWSVRAELADHAAFETCSSDTSEIPQLARDTAAARRLYVQGTPTLLIGRIRYNGVPSLDSLRQFLKRAKQRGDRETR